MPSSYLTLGAMESFGEYARRCMGQFGPLIHCRDSGGISLREPAVDHREKAKKALADLNRLTPEELQAQWQGEQERRKAQLEQRLEEARDERAKKEEVLAQAKAFLPPTPNHEEWKKMMISLLERDLDDGDDVKYAVSALAKFSPMPFETWLAATKNTLEGAVTRAEEDYKEASAQVDRANAWITQALEAIEAHEAKIPE